jgi:hypothetical protein
VGSQFGVADVAHRGVALGRLRWFVVGILLSNDLTGLGWHMPHMVVDDFGAASAHCGAPGFADTSPKRKGTSVNVRPPAHGEAER